MTKGIANSHLSLSEDLIFGRTVQLSDPSVTTVTIHSQVDIGICPSIPQVARHHRHLVLYHWRQK